MTFDEPRSATDTASFSSSELSVASLVDAADSGDAVAFGELYERHVRLVHGVLLSRVPANDAEDLVQDVFTTALRRLSSLREPAAFGAWLVTIARNIATDFHRRRPPLVPLSEESTAGVAEGAAHTTEAKAALEAIEQLPEAYRETLILRLVEGMKGPEIAERTGLTHGSVRVNLHRGMKLLRERLGLGARDE